MARRRARDRRGICQLCLTEGPLSFEHVPPRAALNDQRMESGTITHWLQRNEEGPRLRRTIQQGGSGFHCLCSECNNRTGSWYASELTRWVHGALAALPGLPPIAEMDRELNDHTVILRIDRVRPLAFVKQIVTMIPAVNDVDFAHRNTQLREFVLERDRVGLPAGIQVYLAHYLGPISRRSGLQAKQNLGTGELHVSSEIAHPPFAYVASFDEPSPLLPRGNITGFSDIPYTTRATVDIEPLVGFGHTPYPADLRTAAQVARDRANNQSAT
jgi:hypothetical protein